MNTNANTLVERARAFAWGAHSGMGQMRKYSGQPYAVHCADVVRIMLDHAENPITAEQIAAAWLHDVVEDTQVSLDTISLEFGSAVAEMVSDLTDVSRPGDGNRRVRKNIDLQHSAQASAASQTVKLADLVSNAPSITEHDPGFARVWLKEKASLLDVLVRGDPGLMSKARQVLAECQDRLSQKG